MVSQKLVGAVAAAGAAVLIPALLLLRKSKGGAQGRSFTLRSSTGIEVEVSEFGCLILRLVVPDSSGSSADVVLGYDELQQYVDKNTYYGALVGRLANRVAGAAFQLDGKTYQLAQNDSAGPNALHGGKLGFDKRQWQGESVPCPDGDSVRLTRTSSDGEEGYPGTLTATVTYTLKGSRLTCTIDATTTAPTPVNMTQHSYFNLGGHDSGDVLGHELTIHGDHYTPKDSKSIPRGEIAPSVGTGFDFVHPRTIGSRVANIPGGYDHNYVLRASGTPFTERTSAGMGRMGSQLAAELHDPKSGRTMKVSTNAPGLQFYSGNFMDGSDAPGKGGAVYGLHGALCLEPQGFPNAVNEPSFPSVILRPGEKYHHVIDYDFSW